MLEQTHGRVQHLVIDPEGEYHTLREKFDYVLAAPQGGDTVAHPRTAKLLAERLLQLGVSAILDIYELEQDARKEFVKGFISAVVNAPRALWHPALIVLDEAHVYAPEGRTTSAVAPRSRRWRLAAGSVGSASSQRHSASRNCRRTSRPNATTN